MREHAEFFHHVIAPENIGILARHFDRRLAGAGHVLPFAREGSVIPAGLAIEVEAKDFAPGRHDIDFLTHHVGRGDQADIIPVVDLPARQLRHDELPEKIAVLLVHAEQDRAIIGEPGIARRGVIRSDQDFAVRGHRIAVALGTELHDPLDVLRR